jgi:UDP-GlcNAc:undecaprenyl-phosphate/decaprenyl-phosphate GlcNAc-1-phosphate transferase
MGGVAVYAAFVIAALTVLPLIPPVKGLIIGGFVAVVVGVLDEKLSLSPLIHLAGQTAAAVIAIVTGVGVVKTISVPTAALTSPGLKLPLILGAALTLFWLVGMMNTINFLDGLDGLATGITALAALFLAAWAAKSSVFYIPTTPHHEELYLPLALAGALIGFLPYNWHQARIFLGDSGSMFLGLSLGALSIVGPAKLATALLVLMIPVLDVLWAIVRRQMQGRSFLAGDKQHVYHRMLELGLSHTSTVLVLYVFCLALAVLDLSLFKLGRLIAFVLLATFIGAGFVLLEIRSSRRSDATEAAARVPANEPEDREGINVAR